MHLQWSLTSCTMWFDSMQSKRGHEGQISVLNSRCSYSSSLRLLQVAPRSHATVLQRRLCLGCVQGQEACRAEGKYGGMRLATMFFNTSQERLWNESWAASNEFTPKWTFIKQSRLFFDSVHNAGFLRISRLIASLLRLYEAQNYCRSNPVLIIIAASDCCSHSGV